MNVETASAIAAERSAGFGGNAFGDEYRNRGRGMGNPGSQAGWMVLTFFLTWIIVWIIVLLILYAVRPTSLQGTAFGGQSCDSIGKAALTALWISLFIVIIVSLIWYSVSSY
jgi:hypothetical protein